VSRADARARNASRGSDLQIELVSTTIPIVHGTFILARYRRERCRAFFCPAGHQLV
jgi:hypothetical protein